MRFAIIFPLLCSLFFQVAHSDELRLSDAPSKLSTDAATDPVEGPKMHNVYATGMYYARPTRGRAGTGVFNTNEMHLVVGNFQDDTKYSGNTIDVSTKSRELCNKVDELDNEKHYIFKYWYSYPMHFNMEKTYIMVTSFEDSQAPANFLKSGLPIGFDVKNGRVGWQTPSAIATGRMVDVFRWNTYILGRPICSFVLDSGGSRRGDKDSVANEMTFNVYSETGCKYVESILPFGLELRVTFNQKYFSMDGYDHTADMVMVDRIPGMAPARNAATFGSPMSQELINDPEFQKRMIQLIDQRWHELHPTETPRP